MTYNCLVFEHYLDIWDLSWYDDKPGTSAIRFTNPKKVTVFDEGMEPGFVWIKTQITFILSVFLSPNEGIIMFLQKMRA